MTEHDARWSRSGDPPSRDGVLPSGYRPVVDVPQLRVAAAVCLLVLVAGCSGSSSPAEPARAEQAQLPELSAVAVYGRHAAVRGKVDVRLVNDGPGPAEVETLRLEHPLFEPVEVLERRSTLPPDGQERIVPVPFGAPRCDADDAAGAVVVLAVTTSDGVRDVEVPLTDGEPGLVRAHRIACAADDVGEQVALSLGPEWRHETTDGARVLVTSLRLDRRGEQPVRVTQLSGNILFTMNTATSEPVVALPAEQDTTAAEVRITATRCEPHALTESKRSFTFPLFVAVGDGEPAPVPVTADVTGQAALQSLLDATCGPTGTGG